MFTGFASENTPAIQVWDFFRAYTGQTSISLTDDCAPIQYIRTGSNTTAIYLYLPTAPIEGKQIKIVNQHYGTNAQIVQIYASDTNDGGTTNLIYTLGQGHTLDLCYSKNFISFGTGVGAFATGWITLNQSPTGARNSYSVISGGISNNAQFAQTFMGGGSSNTASNTRMGFIGGLSNSGNGGSSFVGGGSSNVVNGASSAIIGGNSNSASGTQSAVIAGSSCSASGTYAVAVGGDQNAANGNNSVVVGGARGTARSIVGNTIFSASNSPVAFTVGASQSALLILGRQTTNATATRLASDTFSADTTNQVILPNNSAYVFQGTCIANVTGGSTTSGWKFEGVIKRGANAASTTLVAAVTPTVIAQDALATTWVLAITADTTNGGIAVTVTGAAATTIRWVSRIETTEVTF
jgi:hypothetical protein